ncbi:hypothetical protein [Asaia spathodeae]|uniref:Lipoprotein n=1 Tax=Asaia spathodeae TaxID=657016 RepID=A0ABX2P5S6_9PROT|nr:hypothetical protein [Asaia spathodeae]GBR20666.1 hypothetical protein AA105894_2613 [Asaia spathodeae NBRC 105894]
MSVPGRSLVAALPLVLLAACQSPAKPYLDMGRRIAEAGFIAHPADTTARYAMMNTLPPGVMTYRESPSGLVYLYADPIGCGCVYMGTDVAYAYLVNSSKVVNGRHKPIRNVPPIPEMSAENRRDTALWDWSAWSHRADPGATQPRYVSGAYW